MDKYNERLVKGKPSGKDYLLIAISVLVILFGLFVIVTISISTGILVLAIGIFAISMTVGNLSVEFEYTLTNGDIDIAKIISMKKRKALGEVKLGDIICMDIADSNKVTHDIKENPNVVIRNYTANDPDGTYYAVYTSENGKEVISLFDFDEKCVSHMKFYLKTKSLI